ncbi:MAG: class I SAM-dependent methyltransferase [Anaerolineales bacterium]|nr:class I SAM-dependent methyltransferase [Anaerolineales bacterium]
MLVLSLLGLNLLLFVLALLWILVPAFYGLPSKPTKPDRIRKALQMVNLKQDELLYDLGAGDGRVLFIAAKEFGAKAIGIEIGPVQCALIWLRVTASGLANKVQIQWGDFFKSDLSKADVVYVYATSKEVAKLASYLEKMMKRGSRLVSISADFPAWEPSAFDEENLIFSYEMPPKEGSLTTYLLKNTK